MTAPKEFLRGISNKPLKPNRPEESRWIQQTLPLWKPILTLWWAIGILGSCSLGCLVLGILIFQRSQQLGVYRVVYDGPTALDAKQPGGSVDYLSKCHLSTLGDANSFSGKHTCFVNITLQKDMIGHAIVYYELDRFYQNHRRMVTSQLPKQYTGDWQPLSGTSACDPLEAVTSIMCIGTVCESNQTKRKSRALYPCGLVANTMFNDIFWLHYGRLPSGKILGRSDLIHHGIARTFATYNFVNPPSTLLDPEIYLPIWNNPNYSRIIPPPGQNLMPQILDDYSNSTAWVTIPPGTGVENEWFRVWVDISASPVIRKPYGRIEIPGGLPKGTILTFAVQSNFFFNGSKALVVAEIAWFGSENIPLAIAFLIAGSISGVTTLAFVVRAVRNPRKLGDTSCLKWKLL